MRNTVFVVFVLAITTLGSFLDGVNSEARATSCDTLCRETRDHYFCPSGGCVHFVGPTCFFCGPNVNFACVNDGSNFQPYCSDTQSNGNKYVEYTTNCTALCTCGSYNTVEAQYNDATVSITCDLYKCTATQQ